MTDLVQRGYTLHFDIIISYNKDIYLYVSTSRKGAVRQDRHLPKYKFEDNCFKPCAHTLLGAVI